MDYKKEQLDEMTIPELKDICYDLGIAGVSKKTKYGIVEAIMAETGELYSEDNLINIQFSIINSKVDSNAVVGDRDIS